MAILKEAAKARRTVSLSREEGPAYAKSVTGQDTFT
jgi:hypothetical protein